MFPSLFIFWGGEVERDQSGPSRRVHTLDNMMLTLLEDMFCSLNVRVCTYLIWPTHHTSSPLRMGEQIQIQLNHMKDIYGKLEKIQSDCAVTRSARRPCIKNLHKDMIIYIYIDNMIIWIDQSYLCFCGVCALFISYWTSFSLWRGQRCNRKSYVFLLTARRQMLPWTTLWWEPGLLHVNTYLG